MAILEAKLASALHIMATYASNTQGIGYSYDLVNDVFIAPQPYPSWSLDENFDWQPPTPRPEGEIGQWYLG
jgi:hypothetical protein